MAWGTDAWGFDTWGGEHVSTAVTGLSATSAIGNETILLVLSVPVTSTGATASGIIGMVTMGLQATTTLGGGYVVSAAAGVTVTGLSATAPAMGGAQELGWSDVVTTQTPNWAAIAASQTPSWSEVSTDIS